MEQAETTLERQKRLAREQQPPTTSAKVFRWVKDIGNDRYIRKQVHKKWRSDTLANYSTKQVQYDSFSNEWDCSSQFDSDDESDGVGADYNEEDLFVDYNLANEACSAAPLASAALKSPSVNFGDDERWLPFASQVQTLSPGSTSVLDMYEEEIVETASIHFGYLPPLPARPKPPLLEASYQKNFLRILGLSWNADSPSLFNWPRILALVDFMEKLSSQVVISADEWDLSRENRACVAFNAVRFRLLAEVQGPNGPLFMLDLHEHATVKWTLTLTTAAHALLVCRLHPQF
ncbi:hypothetical protein HYPSUDRAFT_607729 [Hypholoma sublateritium FD-334 SS-4]|uniref:Uncharacterized protein n=1 Tax=Hypholoma sublateritium (strain FD-334 SS-4) TaxID=945553 RepID=A0A0D2L747_HYPSF|nr:hypothetical protein HYPSUDRAFT_607729 [Hypholoma sublateritium FD-334 SS-4]